MAGQYRSEIKVGMSVGVILKDDQKSGKITKGIVARILTKNSRHTRGIKVMLEEDGLVGRVQETF